MEQTLNIHDIPIKDIYLFLAENDIPLLDIKDEQQAYQLTEKLIILGVTKSAPDSIVNWILAYNTFKSYNIDEYNLSEIIKVPDDDLVELSYKLGLKDISKYNIVEILSYMNKLNNDIFLFEMFHEDLLIDIMSHLDHKSIKLMSEISPKARKIYESIRFAPILKQKTNSTTNFYGKVTKNETFLID